MFVNCNIKIIEFISDPIALSDKLYAQVTLQCKTCPLLRFNASF